MLHNIDLQYDHILQKVTNTDVIGTDATKSTKGYLMAPVGDTQSADGH